MSPRVKIPTAEGHSQPSSSSSLHRRKSSVKRPLIYSDEDDEDVHDRARIPSSQKTKHTRADTDESPSRDLSPVDPDMDVDIDTYEPSVSAADDVPPPATNLSLADPSPSAKDTTGQPPPKKRKLPTIKKNKPAGATGTSTPATTHKPPPPPTQELPKPSVPVSEQRKQALTGMRDIDLADTKIYEELFKGTGGIAPRSGLKKDEERRKELDRMRDEARARRAGEAKFIFDLQSQANKIARFEQRLRAENSTVLHPNFLAAKFRDEWELERRQKRRDERGKEEGEAQA